MNSELAKAIKEGNLEKMIQILDKNPTYLDQTDQLGNSLLNFAVIHNRKKIVEYLLTKTKIDKDITNAQKDNALFLAASTNKLDILEFLLKNNHFKPEDTDVTGKNILHLAVFFDKRNIVGYLLKNYPQLITSVDVDGNTPFLLSVIHGCTEIMHYLIDNKFAAINAQEGLSALARAAELKQIDTVSSLMKLGVCVNKALAAKLSSQKKRGMRPILSLLDAATQLLQDVEEDIKSVSEAMIKNLEIVHKKINFCRIEDGNTLLHIELRKENPNFDFIIRLLNAKISTKIPNSEGVTAETLFLKHRSPAIRCLGYLLKLCEVSSLYYKQPTSKPEGKESKETKEITETKDSKDNKELQDIEKTMKRLYASGIECLHMLDSSHPLVYKWGQFLASPFKSPFDAKRAYELLKKIPENDSHFRAANVIIYKLLCSNKLTVIDGDFENPIVEARTKLNATQFESETLRKTYYELLIYHLQCSGLEDQPMDQYVASYLGENTKASESFKAITGGRDLIKLLRYQLNLLLQYKTQMAEMEKELLQYRTKETKENADATPYTTQYKRLKTSATGKSEVVHNSSALLSTTTTSSSSSSSSASSSSSSASSSNVASTTTAQTSGSKSRKRKHGD